MDETTRDNVIDLMNENTRLKTEVEGLREENSKLLGDRLLGKSRLMQKDLKECHEEIERLREFIQRDWPYEAGPLEVVAARDAKIERLRGLLGECIEWVEFKENGGLRYAHGAPELVKRVREALGGVR